MQKSYSGILVLILLVLELVFANSFVTSQASSPSTTVAQSPLLDPYANLTGYEQYLEAMWHPPGSGFPTAGFNPPTTSPTGGDYYDMWMDDAGKITTAFTEYGNYAYADKAASFIMDNAINDSGFLYVPQRTVNTTFSYLHVNTTQLTSSTYQSEFNPLQNIYFENASPADWTSNVTGSGVDSYQYSGNALEGNRSAYTSSSGVGSASYYQDFPVNRMTIFAHPDSSATIPSNGDGIIGNLTGEFGITSSAYTNSGSSASPFQWLFDSYLTFNSAVIIPQQNNFTFSFWADANQSLTGVTLTALVNETCSNYSVETSPWSSVSETVNLGTTPQQFVLNVSSTSGEGEQTVPAGCALRFVVQLNPNTSHEYIISILYGSGSTDSNVVIPYLSTINLAVAASTQFSSFSLLVRPMLNQTSSLYSATGYYFAIVTNAGTVLITNGTTTQADIPGLRTPIYKVSMNLSSAHSSGNVYYLIQANGNNSLFSSISSSAPNAILQRVVFGVTSTSPANITAGWDSIHFWLAPPMLSNTPNPSSGQYITGGYWYGTNGNIDFTNTSVFANAPIYEQSAVDGIATANENDTMASYFGAPNLLSQSPFVNSLIPVDTYYNATGYNFRDVFPYNYAVSQPLYRLYVSGGNGSNINFDMLVAADGYQNVYVWLNATVIPGRDYYQLTEQMVNYGNANVFVQDLAFGVGALSPFSSYEPWLIWTQYPNGTLQEGAYYQDCPCVGGDANSSMVPPNQNQVIWNPSYGGSTPPTAMLVTGIDSGIPAENTNGLFLKFLNSTSLEEVRFNPTIFGHSIRIGMLMNTTDPNAGTILHPGQASPKFVFDATPIIRTMYTEPNVLFDAFNTAITTPGVDISMPATWGYDTYGLALLGQRQNNQTVLNFAKELWNSQWQDVSQRYNGFYDKFTGTTLPTHAYYRSLYIFALAGLVLFPNNSTVISIAQNIANLDIIGIKEQYGLPVSQEEYGAAANLLANLYQVSSSDQQLQSEYLSMLSFMLDSNGYNITFVPHTLTQWTQGYGGFSYNTYLPSIWSDSSTGQIVFWCNHPLFAYKCAELTSGYSEAVQLPNMPNDYSDPRLLVSVSLLWEISNYQTTGTAFFTNDVGFRGNSNTEVQPDSMVAMLTWMEAMQQATGTFVANVQGAGLSYIQYDTYEANQYNSLIVGLSVPAGKTANITINYGGRGGPPTSITDNGLPVSNYQLNTTSGDVVLTNVASQIMLLWPSSSGKGSGTSTCAPSGAPMISAGPIYAQIGKTTTATATITNENNNVSTTVQGITYDPPAGSGIQMVTQSGLPQTVQPLNSGAFKISVTISNSTKPGEYNVTGTAPISEDCNGNTLPGQIGFTIQVIAQQSTHLNVGGFSWLVFLDSWWWALTIAAIVSVGGVIMAVRRDDDGY